MDSYVLAFLALNFNSALNALIAFARAIFADDADYAHNICNENLFSDPEMLNGLNWTATLDDIFKENHRNDATLGWQYFGSFYGFMRVYPAFRWPDQPNLPDLFDVRRRSWYIQSSVTPKDVIILFDRSGSVHGPTLDMMKITAKALINSLGENDYLNVAWFNNKVKWIVPCLDSLVQATSQVKRLFGDAVERLTESNLTNYAVALDFAFNEFKKENLLGVMGIDIPIEEIVKLFPKDIMGAFGYPFAVNTNGFVIFHPRLYDHIIYIQDPPNLYLTDLEGDTEELEELEKQIVKGSKGSLKGYRSIVPVGLGKAILTDMDYFYGPVDSSTIRFGIALPSKCFTIKIRKLNMESLLPHLTALEETTVAPWKFCLFDDAFEDLTVEKLAELITYNYSSCNEYLINHVLWDAEKVSNIKNYWSEKIFPEVISRFLMTSGGLTTVQSSNLSETNQKHTDPLKNNFYKRASSTSGFVFSVGEKDRDALTVAGRIMLHDSYVAAVVGAEIDPKIVQQVFDETVGFEEGQNCNSSELLHCFLINDGGIIIATNMENFRVGDFLGVYDSELLGTLLNEGILNREYHYIYQSWCSKDFQQVQGRASNSFVSVFEVLLKAVISFQWNFLYTTLLYFISSFSEGKKIENIEPTLEFGNYSCVTRSAFYYHSGMMERSGIINCGFHSRGFHMKFLKKVSLLFLVAEPPCNHSNYIQSITLSSFEDVENHHCSKREHYRIRPDKCFTQTPQVNLDCGNTSNSQIVEVNLIAMYGLVFVLLLNYLHIVLKN